MDLFPTVAALFERSAPLGVSAVAILVFFTSGALSIVGSMALGASRKLNGGALCRGFYRAGSFLLIGSLLSAIPLVVDVSSRL